METHYDNPTMSSTINDSSGLTFFYTETAPQYEAGILPVGLVTSSLHVIPPGTENFNSFGDCAPECTRDVSLYICCSCICIQCIVLYIAILECNYMNCFLCSFFHKVALQYLVIFFTLILLVRMTCGYIYTCNQCDFIQDME